jgi:hypothetical protein
METYNFAEGKHFIGNEFETIFLQPMGRVVILSLLLPLTVKLLCIATTVESLNLYKEKDANRISIPIAFSLNSLY